MIRIWYIYAFHPPQQTIGCISPNDNIVSSIVVTDYARKIHRHSRRIIPTSGKPRRLFQVERMTTHRYVSVRNSRWWASCFYVHFAQLLRRFRQRSVGNSFFPRRHQYVIDQLQMIPFGFDK